MKKIVMGIAAVAMAASMFAADVSAKLVYDMSLYGDKAVLGAPSMTYDVNNTHYTLAANGDAAGATINIAPTLTKGDVLYENTEKPWENEAVKALKGSFLEGSTSLWFKPADSVKITVGGVDTGSINRGTFAWWARTVHVESANAIMLNTDIAGVGIECATFGNALLDFNQSGYGILGNFYLNATYGLGDAGNLGFVVTKGAAINAYGVGGWKSAGLAMCLSYDHMPWQTTGFYADVLVNLDLASTNNEPLLNEVATQFGGQYVADGLALRLTAMVSYGDEDAYDNAANNTVSYGVVAWASYNIEGWEPYVKVVANELSNKKFNIDAGVTKGFGAAAIDARFAGSYDGSAFSWSIPCTISCGL